MKNSDPIFWPAGDIDLSMRQQIKRNYDNALPILQSQWTQADIDQRCAMGDQDIYGQLYPTDPNSPRSNTRFNFNLVNSTVQMISGYQRRNRKSSICIPMKSGNQKTSDQMTKCLFHVHNQNGAYQIYSDAFEQGALIQGIGFVSIYKDLTNDPISGDIGLRYIDFKSVITDPYWRRHDMRDCGFIHTRQFFDKDDLARSYPELQDKILSLSDVGYRDDQFYFMPEVYQIQFPKCVAFDEYWCPSTREATYLIDIETNEVQEFPGDEEDLRVIMMNPMVRRQLRIKKMPKPTVRRCLLVNDKVVLEESDPNKIDRYPYVPWLGYFSPDTAYYNYKYKGVVRDLRDTQYLFNLRKVTDLDILSSQQQGLIIKKGALVTPEDGLNAGNGRILTRHKDSVPEDVQPMQIVPPSPVMLQMEEMLKDLIPRISAVNETMLGSDINDKAGIISMMRNAAGITTLTRLFDQADESQRLCGDIITQMIQQHWTYGKVRQVIGEEPTQEFKDKLFLTYGCKIIQGALTESQQQLELQQLLYFRETTGIDIPASSIIKAATLQNKDELIQQIEAREKATMEMQQKRAELEMQQIQIDNQAKQDYSYGQRSLGDERIAKIQTDQAVALEKIRRSEQEDTQSLLNLTKMLKELDGLDLDNIQKKINMLTQLDQHLQDQSTTKEFASSVSENS